MRAHLQGMEKAVEGRAASLTTLVGAVATLLTVTMPSEGTGLQPRTSSPGRTQIWSGYSSCAAGECAADAACRAVQLKVAIIRWLRLHKKEGLYQEEKITARTSSRSHLINKKVAQIYNFMCGGGSSKMTAQASPSPKWRVGGSKQWVYSPPPPTWGPAKMTCHGPARDPPLIT